MTTWMLLASALVIGSATVPVSNAVLARTIASPFDGEWRIEYPCRRATGIYAERCAAGQRDILELHLFARGDKLCGTGPATAQLGNHVDGAEITGTVHGDVATVNWDIMNAHGIGTMIVRGKTLIFYRGTWTSDDGASSSFPPGETTVLRRNGDADPRLAICPSGNDDGA